jgi:membrane-anchored glycerophosphoryl diester phosphodiesterase (GDPDase)
MYLCGLMQEYALTSEISKYQELVGPNGTNANLEKMAWFAGNGVLSFGTVIIVFFIGAICMFTVPSISTWIISTSGVRARSRNSGQDCARSRKFFLNFYSFLLLFNRAARGPVQPFLFIL